MIEAEAAAETAEALFASFSEQKGLHVLTDFLEKPLHTHLSKFRDALQTDLIKGQMGTLSILRDNYVDLHLGIKQYIKNSELHNFSQLLHRYEQRTEYSLRRGIRLPPPTQRSILSYGIPRQTFQNIETMMEDAFPIDEDRGDPQSVSERYVAELDKLKDKPFGKMHRSSEILKKTLPFFEKKIHDIDVLTGHYRTLHDKIDDLSRTVVTADERAMYLENLQSLREPFKLLDLGIDERFQRAESLYERLNNEKKLPSMSSLHKMKQIEARTKDLSSDISKFLESTFVHDEDDGDFLRLPAREDFLDPYELYTQIPNYSIPLRLDILPRR